MRLTLSSSIEEQNNIILNVLDLTTTTSVDVDDVWCGRYDVRTLSFVKSFVVAIGGRHWFRKWFIRWNYCRAHMKFQKRCAVLCIAKCMRRGAVVLSVVVIKKTLDFAFPLSLSVSLCSLRFNRRRLSKSGCRHSVWSISKRLFYVITAFTLRARVQ